MRQQATEPGTLVTGQILATTMAPRASRRVSTRQAESLRHDGDRCRHEWRHGTQDCVRHKSKKPRVIAVRLSSTRGDTKGRRSGRNDRPAPLRDWILHARSSENGANGVKWLRREPDAPYIYRSGKEALLLVAAHTRIKSYLDAYRININHYTTIRSGRQGCW